MINLIMKYLYPFIIVAWVAAVGYFIYYMIFLRQRKGRSKSKRRRRGKRCPECKNMIDYRREVCQHCGYRFPSESGSKEALSSGERTRSKKRGKRCPKCGNKVGYSRAVCQYCGYTFYEHRSQETADSEEHSGKAVNPGDSSGAKDSS
jgi:predicted amidophosphoribosyltransferase